ncbi:U4/U6 small nuclear ribonucleoprotein Prp31-like isoform X2 [Haliotis rufescens]|uniref:U4/U6 small nuclear ribonucleoprotein Prp31-like isoform X2 n=1 Tax=Haliotis rufescens TaxID=6454 RepID=UPI00201F6920|nr:U4/U6 small nuclear ribonucleoprotein Prp31-like isoform X2 [Haliotis rufescens]
MSLADELLADLEEGTEDVGQDDGENVAEVADVEDVVMEPEIQATRVTSVAKLRDSQELAEIMNNIKKYSSQSKMEAGPVEANPEYRLIVDANNMTVEIDNEINVIHKFVRDLYSKRFPELESLVQTPMEYISTVKELGNNILEMSKNNEVLQEILTSATIMVVSVTASTTQGSVLSTEEFATVMEACDMAIDLHKCKVNIFEYVESRMSFISPNLSIIVGASVAAKLMGVAGGLTNLSKMPSCNILVLGSQKKTLSGFSTTAILPHTGFIYYSEIVQKTPPDLRRKAARLVSSKCTLAARVDSFHESLDGNVGDTLLAEIEQKLDKMTEPPPVKFVKPLPAPIDPGRKKRGGRRARKMKERLGLTEMRKQTNRMNFGEIEEDAYQDDLGFSLGSLGKSASGKIRGPPVDAKTKARISKTLQQKLSKQSNTVWGGSTTVKKQVAGTASSVAFTPLQGLEIVNPQAGFNVLFVCRVWRSLTHKRDLMYCLSAGFGDR